MLPAEQGAELAQGPVTIDIDATDVEVYGNKKRGVAYAFWGSGGAGRTWRPGRRPRSRWPPTCSAGDQDPRSSVVALLGRALAALPQAVRDGAAAAGQKIALRADAGVLRRGPRPRRRQGGHGVRDRRQADHQHVEGTGRDRRGRLAGRDRHGKRAGRRLTLPARRMARRHGPADPPGSAWTQSRSPPTPVPAPPHPAPRSAGAADPGAGGWNPPSTPTASSSPTSTCPPRPGPQRASTGTGTAPPSRTSSATASTAPRCGTCPRGYEQVNTAWMWASLIAAAVAAWLHQLTGLISGGELLEGHGTRGGKAMIATLRRTLIATPARLVRHGGQLIMRLAPGPHLLPRPSSPPSAPCQPPAGEPQPASPRDRQAVTGTRTPRHGPRPRTSRKAQNPRTRRESRAIAISSQARPDNSKIIYRAVDNVRRPLPVDSGQRPPGPLAAGADRRRRPGQCRAHRPGRPVGQNAEERHQPPGAAHDTHGRRRTVHRRGRRPVCPRVVRWITPGRLEALIPGRIQSHGGTAEVPRGAA